MHETAVSLGPDRSPSLLIVDAYTGCDTVPSFGTKGNKSSWEGLKVFKDSTSTFLTLFSSLAELTHDDVAVL